jgi:hypothetical protein
MTEPVSDYRAGVVKHNDPYSRISAQIADLKNVVIAQDAILTERILELTDAIKIIAVVAADEPPTPGIVQIRQVLAKLAEREP